MKTKIFILLMLILVSSCGGGNSEGDAPQFDQNAMLSHLAENVIVPGYQELAARSGILQDSITQFCLSPDEANLTTTRSHWRDAKDALKFLEVINFGPYKDEGFKQTLDFWPAEKSTYIQAIVNHEQMDQEQLKNLGASARGFRPIEFLLFGEDQALAVTLSSFTEDELAINRCAYLTALAEDVASQTAALNQAWVATAGNYSASFSKAGQGSTVFPKTHDAISMIVNQMAQLVELIKDQKIGTPLGNNNGGEPQPQLVETPFSEYSLSMATQNLKGILAICRGDPAVKNGLGFCDLLSSKTANHSLDAHIVSAIAALEKIPSPLSLAVADPNDKLLVEDAYNQLKTLKDYLASTVASVLGVSVGPGDADGD